MSFYASLHRVRTGGDKMAFLPRNALHFVFAVRLCKNSVIREIREKIGAIGPAKK